LETNMEGRTEHLFFVSGKQECLNGRIMVFFIFFSGSLTSGPFSSVFSICSFS
jgi:hypothetical protein